MIVFIFVSLGEYAVAHASALTKQHSVDSNMESHRRVC